MRIWRKRIEGFSQCLDCIQDDEEGMEGMEGGGFDTLLV